MSKAPHILVHEHARRAAPGDGSHGVHVERGVARTAQRAGHDRGALPLGRHVDLGLDVKRHAMQRRRQRLVPAADRPRDRLDRRHVRADAPLTLGRDTLCRRTPRWFRQRGGARPQRRSRCAPSRRTASSRSRRGAPCPRRRPRPRRSAFRAGSASPAWLPGPRSLRSLCRLCYPRSRSTRCRVASFWML